MAVCRDGIQKFFLVICILEIFFGTSVAEDEWDELKTLQKEGEQYHISADYLQSKDLISRGRITFLDGHVKIIHGSAVLTAEKAWVYHRQEKTILKHDVYLIDEGNELRADHASYDRANGILTVQGHVDVKDSTYTMQAKMATYDRNTRILTAEQNVQLTDAENHIKIIGEKLEYDRQQKYAKMTHTPRLTRVTPDDSMMVTIIADQMELFEENRNAVATGNVKIIREDLSGNDTTKVVITAEKVEVFRGEQKAVAIGNVEITREDVTATCIIATLYEKNDLLILSGNPEATQKQNEMTADEMLIHFNEQKLNTIELIGNGKAYYTPPDSVGDVVKPSSAMGDTLIIDFVEGNIDQIDIIGNALSIYYPEEVDQRGNFNRAAGHHIQLFMNENKPNRIKIKGNAEGLYEFQEKRSNEEKVETAVR